MPTSTDLVTDLPADFEVFGQAVDTRLKALQPGTTLGDLAYSSATANTNTRLALGTAGQVLTVNSGATAPEWATVAGANWSLLNAGGTALTGAQTITVSGISGKDKIAVVVNGASSANASSEVSIRFNADTGSNYAYAGNQFIGSTTYSSGSFVGFSNLSVTSFPLGRMGANAASLVHGTLYLTGGNSTGLKMLQSSGGGTDDGSATGMRNYNVGGFYNSASTISSVSVFSSTGNFDAGTVYIYTSA